MWLSSFNIHSCNFKTVFVIIKMFVYLLTDIVGKKDFFHFGRHALSVKLVGQRGHLVEAGSNTAGSKVCIGFLREKLPLDRQGIQDRRGSILDRFLGESE